MPALLILTILLPFLGGLVLFAGGSALDRNRARSLALGTVLATLVAGLPLFVQFDNTVSGPQFALGKAAAWGISWIGTPDIRLAFGLDGLSIGLFTLTNLLMISAVCASWEAIKVPLFPFHSWLPLAHVEAPTAGSILLAGVLLKVGGYGLMRFNLAMTPIGAKVLFPVLAILSVTGAIYGALAALAQKDIKRLVAYSSVSHMGIICLGLFALNATGIAGGTIQMINHGLTTGALFACVGVIYERYHTRDMSALGGLWNRMPKLAFFLIIASLGSIALPGMNGFVGEFPILVGMYATSPTAGILAGTSMILGAFYTLWMLQRVLFGPLREPGHGHGQHHGHTEHHAEAGHEHGHETHAHAAHGHDDHGHHGHKSIQIDPLGWHEVLGLAPLIVFIFVIGLRPGPFVDPMNPPVEKIAAGMIDLSHQKPVAAKGVSAPAAAPAAHH